ncbi:DASS family sodium-coupled anion symporter [Campylobacter canadensis]|uniref:DASS family sodium-coupled anion symporter n=1 Tax=Campylobacter canadensis TaxID=449520 RepID=UPI0015575E19|nr:DASS family sodium-coupled anion symporter [Campylobacter canadensis]MBZ7994682.1 DASS family sodium-coupled anion symporter [Campylobacter canadensis]MBZ8000006.1 DASS family sodium-coupled anion symporter [Campylobacter canadensis]MBZ8001609.1 DASS family sodium-coupled anion symporter [Campylobacter canadensis]
MLKKYYKFILPILVALIILIIPAPQGLSINAWIYFAVFMMVVIGLILEPIPGALVGLIGVGILIWLKIGPKGSGDVNHIISSKEAVNWGLAGFSNSTVWLIFAAFMLGLGYEKSNLGRRIALLLVKYLGKITLGLGYAVAIADLILSPFIPSNSARSAGIIYPIVSSIPPMMGSYPNDGARKIGSYLVWVALASTCVTSSMFFTALAPNLLAMESAVKSGFSGVTWLGWFIAFAPCGIILFLLTPYLTYVIYPPQIKGSKEASKWASLELDKMGKMSKKEYLMLFLALFALLFWIFSSVDACAVALSVMIALVIFNIITWNDLLSNKAAWNILAWFGSLITLAGGLSNVGFLSYISSICADVLSHFNSNIAFAGIIILFYLLHYFFASTTAHVSALLALFIALSANISAINLDEIVLLMLLSLGIMGIISPYGTGPSPVWFGSAYISSKDFWKLGFIFGMIYLIIFLIICIPWVSFAHSIIF